MLLRDMVKYMGGACCAAVMMCMVGDVCGMEVVKNFSEVTVKITERSQFLDMTQERAKEVKSIGFEGVDIDQKIYEHWAMLFVFNNYFDVVSFYLCNFLDCSFNIFDGLAVSNLTIKNCELDSAKARDVLRKIDHFSIRDIDFSYNKIATNEAFFEEGLRNDVFGIMGINNFDLRGNEFSKDFIDRISLQEGLLL
jgi:hypothetical protein